MRTRVCAWVLEGGGVDRCFFETKIELEAHEDGRLLSFADGRGVALYYIVKTRSVNARTRYREDQLDYYSMDGCVSGWCSCKCVGV